MMTEEQHEILFNGSGYKDQTAYRAISNLSNRGGKMSAPKYQDGDIVEVELQNMSTAQYLLLKCHYDYATAVMLKDRPPAENSVKVISRTEMYFDAGRPGYVYYDRISEYIKNLPEDELDHARKQIALTMGLAATPEGYQPITNIDGAIELSINEVLSTLREELEPIQSIIKKMNEKPEPEASHDDLVRTEAERDIYKELYLKERAG